MNRIKERIKRLENNIPAAKEISFEDMMKEVLSEATKEELSIVVGYNRKGEMFTESESKRMQEELIKRTENKLKLEKRK